MKRGSQPSMNALCCPSAATLANSVGTTRELFIPMVDLLTVGNTGMLVGRIAFPVLPLAPFSPARSSYSMLEFSRTLFHSPSGDSGSRTWSKFRWGLRVYLPSYTAVVLGNCTPSTLDPSLFRRAPCCSFVPSAPPADTN